MSLFVNSKQYTTDIVIDRGLNNVDITETDIRPGKISIDHNGNKLEGVTSEKFLENRTPGTATAADITIDKTLWVNGEKITGTAKTIVNKYELINGKIESYAIAFDNIITAGDFISIAGNLIFKYTGEYDIHGIAAQDGTSGEIINVIVPN